jgi:Inner membrane component domain
MRLLDRHHLPVPLSCEIATIERLSLGNLLWLVLAGRWFALGHLIIAVVVAVTIVGIPFTWAHMKMGSRVALGFVTLTWVATRSTAGRGSLFFPGVNHGLEVSSSPGRGSTLPHCGFCTGPHSNLFVSRWPISHHLDL